MHLKRRILCLAMLGVLSFLTACAGISGGGSSTPPPTQPPTGSIDSVNHVILMFQENRSFDHYFGQMTAFRQRNNIPIVSSDSKIHDLSEVPNFSNPVPSGSIAAYHTGSVCTENLSPDWEEHHIQINLQNPAAASPTNAPMNGFANVAFEEGVAFALQGIFLADQTGRRAMSYFDDSQLNYYYFMASNFGLADNLHSPIPTNTQANRMYMHAATSQGFVHGPTATLTAKTIWQELDEKGVSWKIYVTEFNNPFKTYLSFFSYWNQPGVQAKVVPLSQYFSDVQAGTLPGVSFIESGYTTGRDEHTSNINPNLGAAAPEDVQTGAAFVSSIINALMGSPSWKDSVFLFGFDEGGGAMDHMPPVAVPSPDGIPPRDLTPGKDVAGDFTMTGVRVPNMIISPFSKKNFVSHTPMDYTAYLKFIETRFGLPSLTQRDASMPDLTEFFDFTNGGPWATPPTPPKQLTNGPCDFTLE